MTGEPAAPAPGPAAGQAAGQAGRVLDVALRRPPTLGGGRLVCVDGPAGSGKTTLAAALARLAGEHGSVRVVHMDDLYAGWHGLGGAGRDVHDHLVAPLSRGVRGGYRRYDWARGRFAETHPVAPADLLVLEGAGSGAVAYAARVTVLVWVEAPAWLRWRRAVERDGDAVRDHWQEWAEQEREVFARDRTRERADLRIDGSSTAPPLSR